MEDYKIRTKGLGDNDQWNEGSGFWTYDGMVLSLYYKLETSATATMKYYNFEYSVSEKKWNSDSPIQFGVK